MFLVGFPLLLVPLAIVNIVIFLMRAEDFSSPVFSVPLAAGRNYTAMFSDAVLALAVVMLIIEVVKSARARTKYAMDHLLSLLLFIGAAAEFVLFPAFANATMFALLLLMLVDVVGGFAMGFSARRPRPVPRPEPPPVVERARKEPVVVAAPVTGEPVVDDRAADDKAVEAEPLPNPQTGAAGETPPR